MIAMNRRNAQWVYTGVQGLYWLTYGLMLSFASVYLQGRGFPNRQIGFILGSSYALSSFLQPVIARRLTQANAIERGICALYGVIAGLALFLLLAPLPGVVLPVIVVCVFALQSALQPAIDTLAQRWTRLGCPVDFGKSRGIASLLYAGMTAGMGLLLHSITPLALPAFYLVTVLLIMLLLWQLRLPVVPETSMKEAVTGNAELSFGLVNKQFIGFLAGIA